MRAHLEYVPVMFSHDEYRRKYRGMPFAPWADEAAERAAVRDALGILEGALDRCRNEDMRTEEVMAVLDFFEPRSAKPAFVRNFRKALDCEEPYARWQNANAALNGIKRQFKL